MKIGNVILSIAKNLPVALICLSACLPGSNEGYIVLQVDNTRAPEGLDPQRLGAEEVLPGFMLVKQEVSDPLTVTQFKVSITGEGISEPISKTVSAEASQIEVLGIPVGTGRRVLIEAYNSVGQVIRRRDLTGIEIKPGVVTPIKTSLNTIPLILNLNDGATVLARHLSIRGFGEPGASIRVEAESQNQIIHLNESVGAAPFVVSPSLSTGLFEFTPPVFLLGKQKPRCLTLS